MRKYINLTSSSPSPVGCSSSIAMDCIRRWKSSQTANEKFKKRMEARLRIESEVKSKCAQFPHRILTRPSVALDIKNIRHQTFMHHLAALTKMASDIHAISFCGQKGHWDARVVIMKANPDMQEYEVWVNPEVPGYDDRNSVAPMYGMWENCASCGAACAWVVRPQSILVEGYDEYGNAKKEVLSGIRARLMMHELDHLQGKTIIQQALGPDFVVSQSALAQKDLWAANFPSAEAHMTASMQFFDYVTNQTIVPPGFEWYFMHMAQQQFDDLRIK
jgi:peptide deformylase